MFLLHQELTDNYQRKRCHNFCPIIYGVSKSTNKEKRARKRHKKSCEGKVAYPDKKSAKVKAEFMRAKKNQASIQHYECQECGQWHLGNRSW